MFKAAWDVTIPVACENALPCYNRESYDKILENAKPLNDPEGRRISAFTYLRLSSVLMEEQNFTEFEQFVKRMHGKKYILVPYNCAFNLAVITSFFLFLVPSGKVTKEDI